LDENTFNSQEYSIKLIQIPKISNTNRADAAIEFVRWDSLSEEDNIAYEQLNVIIKDKTVKVEGVNVRRLKPSDVVKTVNEKQNVLRLTQNLHVVLYKLFDIRPPNGAEDPFETQTEYCLYDETHNDYVYQDAWVDFLTYFMGSTELSPEKLRKMERNHEKLKISEHCM
jgi:hypothetical protein